MAKSTRTLCLVLLLGIPFSGCLAQQTTVLWQGFKSEWTYNHKMNRLGSLVKDIQVGKDSITFKTQMSAATGIGKDQATLKTYFSVLSSEDLYFSQQEVVLRCTGREGKKIIATAEVQRPIPDDLTGKKVGVEVLLNGFDLYANDKSAKLQEFLLEIDSIQLDSKNGFLKAHVRAVLRMNCKSLDCAWFNPKVDYTLKSFWLFCFSEKRMENESLVFSSENAWNKKEQHPITPKKFYLGQNELAGFQSIHLKLDRPHWIQSLSCDLQVAESQNEHFLYTDLLQTDHSLKESSPFSGSLLSQSKKGSAFWNVALVKIKDVTLKKKYGSSGALIEWPGKNLSATDARSVHIQTLVYPKGDLKRRKTGSNL